MRVLVACEFSGIVRDSFIAKGHDAWSCDIIPSETPGPHLQCDVLTVLSDNWDMMIAFPPCTYLARSGARWYSCTPEQDKALNFVMDLMNAPITKIAIENPIGAINSCISKPDQIVQPYFFGDDYSKATCLWLMGLPLLTATNQVRLTDNTKIWYEAPGPNRSKNRSRTQVNMALAMANQWG